MMPYLVYDQLVDELLCSRSSSRHDIGLYAHDGYGTSRWSSAPPQVLARLLHITRFDGVSGIRLCSALPIGHRDALLIFGFMRHWTATSHRGLDCGGTIQRRLGLQPTAGLWFRVSRFALDFCFASAVQLRLLGFLLFAIVGSTSSAGSEIRLSWQATAHAYPFRVAPGCARAGSVLWRAHTTPCDQNSSTQDSRI